MKKFICFLAVLLFWTSAIYSGEVPASDTCWAAGDINGDGRAPTVADFVQAIRILTCEVPFPDSVYQLDLNADCRVDTADLRLYEGFWGPGPDPFLPPRPYPAPTCCNPTVVLIHAAAKGDVNADGGFSAADVVLMLVCTFTETGNIFIGTRRCSFCQADLNCDGALTAADVVAEVSYIFSGSPPSGCP